AQRGADGVPVHAGAALGDARRDGGAAAGRVRGAELAGRAGRAAGPGVHRLAGLSVVAVAEGGREAAPGGHADIPGAAGRDAVRAALGHQRVAGEVAGQALAVRKALAPPGEARDDIEI